MEPSNYYLFTRSKIHITKLDHIKKFYIHYLIQFTQLYALVSGFLYINTINATVTLTESMFRNYIQLGCVI